MLGSVFSKTGNTLPDIIGGQVQTYSFADAQVKLILPFQARAEASPTVDLPGLTSLSLSSHRDIYPVFASGRRGLRGYTSGHRTQAGSIGFDTYHEGPFARAMKAYCDWIGEPDKYYYMRPDELPPVDLNITFVSERGDAAVLGIRSAKFLDSAGGFNVNSITMVETYSFLCAGYTNVLARGAIPRGLPNDTIDAFGQYNADTPSGVYPQNYDEAAAIYGAQRIAYMVLGLDPNDVPPPSTIGGFTSRKPAP